MQPWAACHRSTVTNSQPAISARNLTLSLGTREAPVDILRGIDLDIARGSTVALLGPSGSGKSSLMAVLSGLERASGGSLQVAGADFATMDEDALAHARRGRIGIVLQAFHLLSTMTALENVMIPLEIMKTSNIFEKSLEALLKVGLIKRQTHYPAELSGGEQQRVALARALVTQPKLILADEPTGNLDKTSGDLVTKILFDLKDDVGSTMIIVTHSNELADKCDRQIYISDGHLRNGQLIK